jgi:hypothetical protein
MASIAERHEPTRDVRSNERHGHTTAKREQPRAGVPFEGSI